jgi:hypothetical protein
MDFITAYAVYMTVAILVIGLWGMRVPHENVKVVFILAMLWPLSITAILGMMFLGAIKWEMDMAKGKTMFGARKSTNPQVRGFAFTVLYQEFQFFKVR